MLLWFTGLSGAGKTTLAKAVNQHLTESGQATCFLDGDSLRTGLCGDLSFSEPDRQENIRRIGEVSRLMLDARLVVLVAAISPYRASRDAIRERVGNHRFVEIFIDTPLAICEERDPKGLYQKARAGEIREFTGIDSPYEPPLTPDIHINTQRTTDEHLKQVIEYLARSTQTE